MSGMRAISTTSRRELPSIFFFLQGKAPKEIHAILTETLACFLLVRAKDLSALLYLMTGSGTKVMPFVFSETVITVKKSFTYIISTFFAMLRILCHKIFFIISTR